MTQLDSTGKPRPISTTETEKRRKVVFRLPVELHTAAVIAHLRKHYGHFRGFTDDEIDVEFNEDGTARVVAYKETRT